MALSYPGHAIYLHNTDYAPYVMIHIGWCPDMPATRFSVNRQHAPLRIGHRLNLRLIDG